MVNCGNCGKKLGIFKKIQPFGSKEAFCSFRCKKEWLKKKEEEKKELEKVEYKRKCKACGKVWHSLKKRELELEQEIKKAQDATKTAGWGMLAGSWSALGASEQAERNLQATKKELDKLKSCPKCGSHSYTEKEIVY